jgi:hypothetical protein
MDPMKSLAAIFQAVMILAVLVAAWFVYSKFQAGTHELASAEKRAGNSTVQAGQSGLDADATRILAAAANRDHVIIVKEKANAAVLAQAPGAADPVGADLVRSLDVGLCGYAAYRDDPGCPGLRQGDPAGPPHAGEAGSPSTP